MANENRLQQLAAIAQAYGALSGPQFHQEELARQQQQNQQQNMMQLLQLAGLQHYQQQELAARQAALGVESQHYQGEQDSQAQNRALQEKLRTDAINARQQEMTARDDDNFSRSVIAGQDPKMIGYLTQAQMNRDPSVPLSRQVGTFQHQGQVADAQNAWNQFAPAFNVLSPVDRASQYSAMAAKYPMMNSGEVDFSKGFPATPTSATAAAGSGPFSIPLFNKGADAVGNVIGNVADTNDFFAQLMGLVKPTPQQQQQQQQSLNDWSNFKTF